MRNHSLKPIARVHAVVLALVLLAGLQASNAGENWPQFRGPDSTGVAEGSGYPDTWSQTDNVVWRVPVPGRGWASPIVWGDKIFLTSVVKAEGAFEPVKKGLYFGGERPKPTDEHSYMVYCINFDTGDIVWEQVAYRGIPDESFHLKNSLASETPVTDGEHVYAYFGNLGLFCYDMDGNEQWSKRFRSQPTMNGWGTAASPVLYKDRIYIINDNEGESFFAAFDKKTGEELWRVERDETTNWATPYMWENEARTEIVVPGNGKVRSYDLDGNVLWELKGMSKLTIPTPFSGHGFVYVSSGYVMDSTKPIYAIRPGASGDVSLEVGETANDSIVWSQPRSGPYNPSPILYGDYLYVLYDLGKLTCFDAKTGEEIYEKRIGAGHGGYTASPWAYDGKIFCLTEDGDTNVIKAGPEFEVLRTNSLDELCMSTPAIAQKSLILRTETKLYRIEKGAKLAAAAE